MLQDLRIKNFVIIDSLTVTFKEGLNILSGETGRENQFLSMRFQEYLAKK